MVRLPPRVRPLFPVLKAGLVAATRAIAPVTQRVGRRPDGLPQRAAATLEDAAQSPGARYVQVRAAETIERPAMLGHPTGMPLTDRRDGESVRRVGLLELPRGRVLGPHRAVLTGDDVLVDEISRYFGTTRPREHPLFLNPRPAPPLEVPGRLGVLASRADSNYYHFLVDALPRIGALEQASDVAPPDRWYVPASTPFQRELLDRFGIGADRRVDADQHPHVRAETLVVPAPAAMFEQNPPWVVDFLRARLLPGRTPGAARRIYVTRGSSANNRSVRNEDAVLRLLADRGFEAIDPGAMTVAEQIDAFADAELIVSAHGAALANLVFASPGAAVVEIFPAGFLLPDYWRLACGVPGLRYRYLSAAGGPRRPTRGKAITRDIDVDVASLTAVLDGLEPATA